MKSLIVPDKMQPTCPRIMRIERRSHMVKCFIQITVQKIRIPTEKLSKELAILIFVTVQIKVFQINIFQ